jgi:hypothetical protein
MISSSWLYSRLTREEYFLDGVIPVSRQIELTVARGIMKSRGVPREPFMFAWVHEMMQEDRESGDQPEEIQNRIFYSLMFLAAVAALAFAFASGLFTMSSR